MLLLLSLVMLSIKKIKHVIAHYSRQETRLNFDTIESNNLMLHHKQASGVYLFQKVLTYSVKIPLLPPSECFRLSDELWHGGRTEVLLAYELPLEVD